MRMPWTVSFLADWLPHMDLNSAVRLRKLAINNEMGAYPTEPVRLNLRAPIRGPVFLRTRGTDFETLVEIVKGGVYRCVLDAGIPCRTVIDLGSNIGLASLYFASAFPSCRVLAVEPNRGTFEILEMNLQPLIAAGRGHAVNAAIWDRDTMLAAWEPDVPDLFSGFKVRPLNAADTEPIRGRSIASLMAEFGFHSVDLLKIDIEGAEVALFRGDTGWLDCVNAIAIEFHERSRDASNFDALMQHHGFRVQDNGGHTVVAVKRLVAAT
jgi:FkbM family methyltransferase